MSTNKVLTILFTPLDGWGPLNGSLGLAEELKARGHRVVFAIDKAFKDKLTPNGFEEEILDIATENDQDKWAEFIEKNSKAMSCEPIVSAEKFILPAFEQMFEDIKSREKQFKDIIERVKPNVIINDHYICPPLLTNGGIPWVWMYSTAPHLAFNDERIPPPWSGLPLNGDKNESNRYRNKWNEIMSELRNKVNEYCVSKGAPKLKANVLHPNSPYLNLYLWPKELDYEELQPMDTKWRRVENFIRTTNETFEVPDVLKARPGKLIFLSMGSLGCANLDLMTRLNTILGKSKHRFIVSKGPLHDKYELPANMWGQRFLPQTAVIPSVDLVVTHGGNNSVTETFFFGKPMLVLPLFGDQYDNAQRVEETGLGLRLNPFLCTEDELLKAVDKLVSDKGLAERMTAIGQRIRKSDDKKVVSDLIERIVYKK